jgi:4-hydroxy-tetrahydrodipicolinate synthase
MAWEYRGILPALQLPFDQNLDIDEAEMRRFAEWLVSHKGIGGLVTNGHTGEVFALTAKQRAQATRLAAEAAKGKVPVVSGICCEGISEAVEHAVMAREAGASGLLLMPPHGWLRFGMTQPDNVVDYFTAVGKGSGLDIIVHIYPSWTRASYSFETLAALAKLPWVKCMKVGTRDMNKYARDLRVIKEADPSVTVLTCHDEYLLPSMVQGVDGALVGFASFIPQMIIDLYAAVQVALVEALFLESDREGVERAVTRGQRRHRAGINAARQKDAERHIGDQTRLDGVLHAVSQVDDCLLVSALIRSARVD